MISSTVVLVQREAPGEWSEILLCENQICLLKLIATYIVLTSFTLRSLPMNGSRENSSPLAPQSLCQFYPATLFPLHGTFKWFVEIPYGLPNVGTCLRRLSSAEASAAALPNAAHWLQSLRALFPPIHNQ